MSQMLDPDSAPQPALTMQAPYGYGAGSLSQYHPAQLGRSPMAGYSAPRSGAKTFFIAGLLSLIPIVGFGMAAIYYFTKQQPYAFDGGRAAGAGLASLLAGLVVGGAIYLALVILLVVLF